MQVGRESRWFAIDDLPSEATILDGDRPPSLDVLLLPDTAWSLLRGHVQFHDCRPNGLSISLIGHVQFPGEGQTR
jgi:hypothetical protein